jgi:hypothetical protein
LLVLGGAGLAALVLAGGAALVLTSGGDDATDLTAAPPKPAATSSPTTTQAPAPLPTSVQFAGRNPFKAKIVEGSGGGGGAAAGGEATETPADGDGGATEPTIVPIPGPAGPEGPAGPRGERGPAGEAYVPILSVTFLDFEEVKDETSGETVQYAKFIVDIGAPEEQEVSVAPDELFSADEAPLSWVRYMQPEPTEVDEPFQVRIQLGDEQYVLTQNRARVVYGSL